jgi:hypothetical protein
MAENPPAIPQVRDCALSIDHGDAPTRNHHDQLVQEPHGAIQLILVKGVAHRLHAEVPLTLIPRLAVEGSQ